jgi:alpha-L-fucosidase
MKELTQQYGPFLAWWFDQRAPSWTHAQGSDLYAYLRSLQPDVLLSHRIDTCYDRGLDNPTWFVTEGKMAGDYVQSEISIPRFNRDIAWEYCRVAGIEGTTWYWKPDDVYRPLNDWILDIVNCLSTATSSRAATGNCVTFASWSTRPAIRRSHWSPRGRS